MDPEHHVFTSSQRHPSHPAILLQYYSYFHWGSGARDELEDSHWPQDVRKKPTLIEYYYEGKAWMGIWEMTPDIK